MKVLKAMQMNRCIGCLSCMITCAGVNQQDHSILKSAIRIKTSGGLSGKFIAIVCQACQGDVPCAEVCPTGALVKRKGGGVTLDKDKCDGCQRCFTACTGCPVGCIHIGQFRRVFDEGYDYESVSVAYDYELIYALGTLLGISKTDEILYYAWQT